VLEKLPPEVIFLAAVQVVVVIMRTAVFLIALTARIRWDVPTADIQRLIRACFPVRSWTLPHTRRATRGDRQE
jgi:hypothetical protein